MTNESLPGSRPQRTLNKHQLQNFQALLAPASGEVMIYGSLRLEKEDKRPQEEN